MLNFILDLEPQLRRYLRRFDGVFTRPSRKSFATYVSGLFLEHRRLSIQSIWERAPLARYSNLQFFLSEAKWDADELNAQRLRVIEKARHLRSSRNGVLVIDDTGCPKPYAEKTDAARVQYCPPLGKTARCNVTVLSAFAAPNRYFPVDLRPYRPAKDFDAGRDDPRFRSKIQLAQELIDHAESAGLRFSDIVFDSWYAANTLLNTLTQRQRTWITPAWNAGQVKANRQVMYRGQWVRADELVTLIPSTRFRRTVAVPNRSQRTRQFHLTSFQARINGIKGKLLIVVVKGSWDARDPHKIHIYATNHRSLTPTEVVRRYALRWKIELIFRELKDYLRFDEYQVRKLKGIARHWRLLLVAHTYLQLLLPEAGYITAMRLRDEGAKAHGAPCLGDALRLHRWNQQSVNLKWIRRHPGLYHVIFVTQPFMNVTARVA